MKPLLKIKLTVRDPMDPSTLIDIGVVEVTSVGDVSIILTRDEMGAVKLETAEVASEPKFMEQLDEAVKTLKELHEQMGATQIAAQHALTDMFAIHKWLNG